MASLNHYTVKPVLEVIFETKKRWSFKTGSIHMKLSMTGQE
jgi:hypothetical protein